MRFTLPWLSRKPDSLDSSAVAPAARPADVALLQEALRESPIAAELLAAHNVKRHAERLQLHQQLQQLEMDHAAEIGPRRDEIKTLEGRHQALTRELRGLEVEIASKRRELSLASDRASRAREMVTRRLIETAPPEIDEFCAHCAEALRQQDLFQARESGRQIVRTWSGSRRPAGFYTNAAALERFTQLVHESRLVATALKLNPTADVSAELARLRDGIAKAADELKDLCPSSALLAEFDARDDRELVS